MYNIDLIENLSCTKFVMLSYIKGSSGDENVKCQVSPATHDCPFILKSEENTVSFPK